MKKIILLLLCCGVLVSMVGCGGNTAPPTVSPPTTVSETVITETPTETIPPVTAVEPTEKEKKPTPTESKDQATEPTVTATEPTTTAWIILKKEDRKSKRSVGQIGRQAIIMRMRAERVIKAVDILKNGKF